MHPSPFSEANLLSKLTFWWLNGMFSVGFRKQLKQDDMFDVLPEDDSSYLANRLQSKLQKKDVKPLYRTLVVIFWKELLLPGIFFFLSDSTKILQPYLIGEIVDYFQSGTTVTEQQVYIYAGLLSITALIQLLCMPYYYFLMQRVAMHMKTAVSSAIYRKVLTISSFTLHKISSGQVVNLLSTDVERFNDEIYTLHFVWLAPIEVIVVLCLLYYRVGTPAFFPLVAAVVLIPLQYLIGRVLGRIRMEIGQIKDERTHLMNEIISGMRVIKMYCWEKPFSKKIDQLRRKDTNSVLKALNLRGINWSIFVVSTRFLTLCIFIGVWLMGNTLSPKTVFSCIGWMDLFSYNVIWGTLETVEEVTQLMATLKRIQTFLELEEIADVSTHGKQVDQATEIPDSVAIRFSNFTGSWGRSTTQNEMLGLNGEVDNAAFSSDEVSLETCDFGLHNIDINIHKGEIVAIVGKVGSGKTSLLMAILGELSPSQGSLSVNGDISYTAQQPWVFSGTVRDNVLFGRKLDQDLYNSVIRCCSLDQDIAAMPSSDLTLVGERGLMLSGGQKARVTLARCLYRGADVFLLDDPLSAVDTIVGRDIFNRCLLEFLSGKTRVLVTHQTQYLEMADKIVILEDGRVKDVGDYRTLSNRQDVYLNAIQRVEEDGRSFTEQKSSYENNERTILASEVEEEHQAEGSVKFWVYRQYAKACYGNITVPLIATVLLASQAAFVAGDWLLAKWAEANQTGDAERQNYFIHGAIIAIILFLLLTLIFSNAFFTMATIASRRLHDQMFCRVLQAKMAFFDNNPVGRVLNRFARDIGIMDDVVPRVGMIVLTFGAQTATFFITTGIINPWLFIPLVLLTVLAFAVRMYAARTLREVKRLESIAKSPVFSHLSDTLFGIHTIRTLRMSSEFRRRFDAYQNVHVSGWFAYLCTYRWLGLRILMIIFVYINFVVFFSLILKNSIPGNLTGILLLYSITYTEAIEFFVRMTAELETAMTSVERVLLYTDLEKETEFSLREVPVDWPTQGTILFKDVSLRYGDDAPMILRNINFAIQHKEKVGIVGRTGAGKSSLIVALLRLAEPTGHILIDGVTSKDVDLQLLRSKISVIPQDPVLFSGTLRRNIDPFTEYSDSAVWMALSQVRMDEKVKHAEGQLEMETTEYGNNFSVGERQLICLARALLRKNKILVLDEATANVDAQTDELIQKTIRDHFHDCTVLTIAHRLNTVMDSDRIMVLDNGQLVEMDTPKNLLHKHEGYFSRLLKMTGRNNTVRARKRSNYGTMEATS